MERSRHWACTFSLLAARFPVPFQCSPDGFPILCRRFHRDFLDLVLDQPCDQQSQLLRIAPVSDAFKLVLPLNFNVGHDHSQHLFMYVDSRYPVRHNVSSWRERRACCEFLKQGHRLSPLSQEERDNAQLFAQPRTLPIRHIDSFNFSTETSISPLRASPILHSTRSNFHELSRAAGPTRHIGSWLALKPTLSLRSFGTRTASCATDFMKPSSWDKQLGLASPRGSAASQSDQT